VARYTFLDSDGINGLTLRRIKTRSSAAGRSYTEGYVGANYCFYGHKLKLQTGVQFAEMQIVQTTAALFGRRGQGCALVGKMRRGAIH
jgi:hypothetical protein